MLDSVDTLELGAFKHVVVPIGVVIGLGVARIVNSLSQYLQQRERVAFSWPHAVWSIIVFLEFVGLWWISWGLRHVQSELWTYFALIFLLIGPSLLYLSATLLLPDLPDTGRLELSERFETMGRSFFLAMAGFMAWLACSELLLLREPLWLPKRASQGAMTLVLLLGAARPSRLTAAVLGAVMLPWLIVALATIRARLE